MKRFALKTVNKAIANHVGNEYCHLYKGDGYFYFVYDNPVTDVYRDYSVMVYHLNDLTIKSWVGFADDIVNERI